MASETSLAVIAPALPERMEEVRRSRDPAAAEGIPPHLTALFPFVPTEQVDEALFEELAEVAAGMAPFDYQLVGPELLGDDVLVLMPEPAEPFRKLITRVVDRWPEHPPYGGEVAVEDLVPHLTLAHDVDVSGAADLVQELGNLVPIEARAEHLSLLVHRDTWSLERRFPLGG